MEDQLKILIVENHEDMLLCLTEYLQQKGHSVLGAQNMESALLRLSSATVDILISDISLPDGDGHELMRQLDPKPYGIAMSGFGTRTDRENSLRAGYKHHLTKPFLPEEMDALIVEAKEELSRQTKIPPETMADC